MFSWIENNDEKFLKVIEDDHTAQANLEKLSRQRKIMLVAFMVIALWSMFAILLSAGIYSEKSLMSNALAIVMVLMLSLYIQYSDTDHKIKLIKTVMYLKKRQAAHTSTEAQNN